MLAIAVAEDDVAALGGIDAGQDGVAVAGARLADDAGAGLSRQVGGLVAAAVVHHHHFAGYAAAPQESAGFVHATGNGALLVAAQDHDGHFGRGLRHNRRRISLGQASAAYLTLAAGGSQPGASFDRLRMMGFRVRPHPNPPPEGEGIYRYGDGMGGDLRGGWLRVGVVGYTG